MRDLLDQLHDYGDALADSVEPVRAADAMTTDAPLGISAQERRARRRWWELAAAAVVLVALIGWGTAQVRDGRLPLVSGWGLDGDLAGRTFRADSMRIGDGPATPAWGAVAFTGGRLEIDQCNDVSTRYALEGDHLVTVGPPGMSTAMDCDDGTEDRWSQILASSPRVDLDGDRLTLTSDTMVVQLVDAEAVPTGEALDGRSFVGAAASDGDQPRPLVPLRWPDTDIETAIRLAFSYDSRGPGDGSISVIGGCSGGQSAVYSIVGGRLETDLSEELSSPGCDPELARQGSWLVDLLESSPLVVLEGSRLSLSTGDRGLELVEPAGTP